MSKGNPTTRGSIRPQRTVLRSPTCSSTYTRLMWLVRRFRMTWHCPVVISFEALDDRSATWSSGPFAEPARALLNGHAEALASALDHYDSLVSDVIGGSGISVLTHGEPHVGNTINTPDGVVLIDWDTLLVALRERDLWSLMGEDPAVRAYYENKAGVTLDDEALSLYSLCWI